MKYSLGQSYFNEAVNGTLMVLALFALVVFIRDLWINRRLPYEEQRASLALSAMFLGIFVIRSAFWYARHFTGTEVGFSHHVFYAVVSVGLALQGWGILCCINVFSPVRCKIRLWLLAICGAVIWNAFWMGPYFW